MGTRLEERGATDIAEILRESATSDDAVCISRKHGAIGVVIDLDALRGDIPEVQCDAAIADEWICRRNSKVNAVVSSELNGREDTSGRRSADKDAPSSAAVSKPERSDI